MKLTVAAVNGVCPRTVESVGKTFKSRRQSLSQPATGFSFLNLDMSPALAAIAPHAGQNYNRQSPSSRVAIQVGERFTEFDKMSEYEQEKVPLSEGPSPCGSIELAVAHVRRMVEAGAPPIELLTCLATAGEVLAGPGAAVSILVLDKDGLLRNGASPNLPRDYLDAIDRLKPDPGVGTCAAAAATGVVVITPDFCADDKWSELRHLPRSLGFVGAWSMPIKSPAGTVLGTFGTYFREHRVPTLEERNGVESLATVAALVLSRV